MIDFSDDTVAVDYRERVERARREARRRYRDHLAVVFTRNGVADPGELADAALDALTVWRYCEVPTLMRSVPKLLDLVACDRQRHADRYPTSLTSAL